MARIAITGAAGIIGSALTADLRRDHDVVAIDLDDADVIADVRDLAALERAFDGYETVIHLAGFAQVESTWEQNYETNIGGTYNAFEAARRAGAKRFIFASSNHAVGRYEIDLAPALYRRASGTLVGVDAPLRPDSLYGVWKVFGEALGRYYSEAFGMQVACLRIGSVLASDNPTDPSVTGGSGWLDITDEQKFERMRATWFSKSDCARLVRCILASSVPYGVVYGVSDNATRFWDLEPGRALYGFWPRDGIR